MCLVWPFVTVCSMVCNYKLFQVKMEGHIFLGVIRGTKQISTYGTVDAEVAYWYDNSPEENLVLN